MATLDELLGDEWPELLVEQHDVPQRATWLATSPIEGGWSVVAKVAMQGEHLIVEEFHVLPLPMVGVPTGGVTTSTLRGVRLGSFMEAVRRRIADPGPIASERRREGAALVEGATASRRGRPPMLSDDYLREVALSRLAADRAGVKGTREWMAGDLEKRGAFRRLGMKRDESQIRDDVKRAREAGWLAPARQGTKGAMAGARLLDAAGQTNGRDDG